MGIAQEVVGARNVSWRQSGYLCFVVATGCVDEAADDCSSNTAPPRRHWRDRTPAVAARVVPEAAQHIKNSSFWHFSRLFSRLCEHAHRLITPSWRSGTRPQAHHVGIFSPLLNKGGVRTALYRSAVQSTTDPNSVSLAPPSTYLNSRTIFRNRVQGILYFS